MIVRRDVELVVLTIVLGPPLGAVAFLFITEAGSAVLGTGGAVGNLRSLFDMIPMIVALSYLLGGVPAALSAIASALLSRRVHGARRRLLLAPLTGAVASLVCLGWMAFNGNEGAVPPAIFLTVIALTGAASSLACVALIERFGTPLPHRATP